jgi:hypothetical protein
LAWRENNGRELVLEFEDGERISYASSCGGVAFYLEGIEPRPEKRRTRSEESWPSG